MTQGIYNSIYKRLKALGLDFTVLPEADKSMSSGYMDLNFDLLEDGMESGRRVVRIALGQYFSQNGDRVPDPDMEIRVYPTFQEAEALTFQNQFVYREVYPVPGKVNLALKKDLNAFLLQWLRTLRQQGHRFDNEQQYG